MKTENFPIFVKLLISFMKKIILIEDETSVVSFIKKGLQENGMKFLWLLTAVQEYSLCRPMTSIW
jgi:hypothetical protein